MNPDNMQAQQQASISKQEAKQAKDQLTQLRVLSMEAGLRTPGATDVDGVLAAATKIFAFLNPVDAAVVDDVASVEDAPTAEPVVEAAAPVDAAPVVA